MANERIVEFYQKLGAINLAIDDLEAAIVAATGSIDCVEQPFCRLIRAYRLALEALQPELFNLVHVDAAEALAEAMTAARSALRVN